MLRYLLIFVVFLGITSSSNAFACNKSHGKSDKDKKVAEAICKVFESSPDILMFSAQESILYVNITRRFFDEMKKDKLKGTQMVKAWMRGMRQESSSRAVTVWVYVDKEKVIDANTSWLGEDKVEFLY